jgi:hypothetical protein
MMGDFDFAILPYPVGEPEIVRFRRVLHFAVLRAVSEVFCEACRWRSA